jgi:hypothetical protein
MLTFRKLKKWGIFSIEKIYGALNSGTLMQFFMKNTMYTKM